MRIALALSAICAVAFGCGRPPAPAVPVAPVATAKAAAATLAKTNSLKLEIRPARFVEAPVGGELFGNQIVWELRYAEFKEEAIERHGFKEMFGGGGEKNALIREEAEKSPLVALARKDTNINLTLRAGVYPGIVSVAQYSNLVSHLEKSEGVDILMPAKVVTAGNQEGMIQVTSAATVVVAGSSANEGGLVTKTLDFGQTASVRALEVTANSVSIEIASRMEEFGGYAGDGKPGASPNFDVTVVASRVKMGRDEVLLLGSPMRMRVTKWKEKVPYLGDVPVLGRFFTKSGAETNFYRLVMIVRPVVK
ncbi:MAG TPA: hypothetical protein VF773_16625 [Verrucomicrobiae bacterium]